jgi:hypothetical protein
MSDDTPDPRKYVTDTRGRPFQSGNPGRPPGARNRATVAAEALLDAEVEGLTRKCIELSLAGDTTALRLCLERIVPPRKSRSIQVALPPVEDAASARAASAALLAAVAAGELTPGEGEALARLLDLHLRATETEALRREVDELKALLIGPGTIQALPGE